MTAGLGLGSISCPQCHIGFLYTVELAFDYWIIRHRRQIGTCPMGGGDDFLRPPRQIFSVMPRSMAMASRSANLIRFGIFAISASGLPGYRMPAPARV